MGPLLFLIYIDDIVNTSLSPGSKISLYTDDMMLFKIINSNADYIDLQNDIDGLNYWVTANHLTFSSSKCYYMIISRKKNPSHPPALKIGSSDLDRVYSYRYLGLFLTSSLCWTEHINDICAKAKRMVGLLYRRFYKDESPQTLFQMYLALVRPHTEYASQVWDPHLQKDIDQLECVQKFALRMCAKQWDLGYAELLNHFKVLSLGDHRNCLSLCTMSP